MRISLSTKVLLDLYHLTLFDEKQMIMNKTILKTCLNEREKPCCHNHIDSVYETPEKARLKATCS